MFINVCSLHLLALSFSNVIPLPTKKKKVGKEEKFSVPIILQVQLLSPGNFTQHLASAVSPC